MVRSSLRGSVGSWGTRHTSGGDPWGSWYKYGMKTLLTIGEVKTPRTLIDCVLETLSIKWFLRNTKKEGKYNRSRGICRK